MASYNELLALIDAYINQNGVQAITGQVLNGVLRAMVDQLGRGYSIMGAADPTTDPGTPDGPESWFASVPGTYTNFDGIQIADGELALLSYTPSDGFAKNTLYDGFKEVTAQIDGNVGTPAVGVSYTNGILSFDFHNMKGETGDPAGFGSVSATIDDNIGTPSVSVAASGPDTARNFAFNFRNLKGETGVTSVLATVDNTSGNPQCAVSLQGQHLTLAFTGLKGAQGDTGSSVDYPFTIVNNLTTNDATQALSAAMGVQLESEVSQLEAKVTELIGCKIINDKYIATDGTLKPAYGWSSTGWIDINNIPIINGKLSLSLYTANYATTIYPALFKDGSDVVTVSENVAHEYSESEIPTGTKYIAFNFYGLHDYVYINYIPTELSNILGSITQINSAISNIKQFALMGSTANVFDTTLKEGLYVVQNATNTPADYDNNQYGWMLVGHENFRLLWQQNGNQFWAKLSGVAEWNNMSGFSYDYTYTICSKLLTFFNSIISSGLLAYNDTTIAASENYQRYLISSVGRLVAYDDARYIVDKYSITPGVTYHIIASKQYNNLVFAFYDKNDNFIQGYGDGTSDIQIYNGLIIAPHNASYVLLAYRTDIQEGSLSLTELLPHTQEKKWYGKKWVAVGDSLTEVNGRTTKNYLAYISEKTGITTVNMGLSGSGYRKKYDTNQAFYQRVANIPTDADVVTIFGSGNDLSLPDYDLGQPSDTGTTTICGCVNNTLDNILNLFLNAGKVPVIGVITPTPWIGNEPTNSGSLMPDYSNAIIECCRRKSIPVLDLYHESNLHPNDATFRTLAYSKDEGNGVHPDETGHKIISPMIENFLEGLIL